MEEKIEQVLRLLAMDIREYMSQEKWVTEAKRALYPIIFSSQFEPPSYKKPAGKQHKCKYCGVENREPDEDCYRNPDWQYDQTIKLIKKYLSILSNTAVDGRAYDLLNYLMIDVEKIVRGEPVFRITIN